MKPGNIFLTKDEVGNELVKVLDFGIAKSLKPDGVSHGHTQTGTLVGSPVYMSPEQMQASKDLKHNTDLWSLGVVAFECVVGERPFAGATLPLLTMAVCIEPIPVPSECGDVPPGFDEWFAKACNRDPEARFQSARELAEALESIAEGEEQPAAIPASAEARSTSQPPRPSDADAALSQSTDALVRSHGQLQAPSDKVGASGVTRKAVALAVALGVVAVVAGVWVAGGSDGSADTSPDTASASAVPAAAASDPRALATSAEPEVVPAASASTLASAAASSASPAQAAPQAGPAAARPAPVAPRPALPKPTKRPHKRDYGF
jgi:serine/threonine-protein kinase